MPTPTNLFSFCSLLMASLFAVSTLFQLNDTDWYFWLPLYSSASIVNLAIWINKPIKAIRPLANLALYLGIFLLMKVVLEDFAYGVAGFWSFDMKKRVVREKFGSGLAVISMFLQLKASNLPNNAQGKGKQASKCTEYGMAILAGGSYVLFLVWFLLQRDAMEL